MRNRFFIAYFYSEICISLSWKNLYDVSVHIYTIETFYIFYDIYTIAGNLQKKTVKKENKQQISESKT